MTVSSRSESWELCGKKGCKNVFAQLPIAEAAPPGQLKGGEKRLGGLQGSTAESCRLCSLRNPGTSLQLSQMGGCAQPGLRVAVLNLLVSPQPLAICVLERRRK